MEMVAPRERAWDYPMIMKLTRLEMEIVNDLTARARQRGCMIGTPQEVLIWKLADEVEKLGTQNKTLITRLDLAADEIARHRGKIQQLHDLGLILGC
jgi:hypothetical protein